MSAPPPRRRRWPRIAALAIVLAAALGVAAWALVLRPPPDVSNPAVEFEEPAPPPPAVEPEPEPEEEEEPRRERRPRERFVWGMYGYDAARTRYLPTDLRPPFRRTWTFGGSKLLEFQPVLARGVLYMVRNNGQAVALSARTGKVRWKRRVARLNASSPAYSGGRVYIAALCAGAGAPCSGNPAEPDPRDKGRVVAMDADTGRIRWARELPSRTESSPLVLGGRVFVGSEDGTVYALRARDGRIAWTHRAGGAVKAGLAYWRGRLFFGDYAGQVTALRPADGSVVWSTGTQGRSFGRAGNFYSTPAVAYGRVYLGNTDGRVYSLSARSGQLAWTKSTGGYVYAAPAVANVPGTKPSVYIGSYDGRFYALDARTGAERWVHNAGGRISGAASVIGGIVYFSNLAATSTTGLDVRNGAERFALGRGAFNPAISDGRRLYITGYSSQYAFEPRESE